MITSGFLLLFMASQIEKMKKYLSALNKKAGNKSRRIDNDDDITNDHFIIRNNRNSIIIGNSDHGQIAIDSVKLSDGEIRCINIGTTGSGKSYVTRNIIEKFYEYKTGIIIVIDPEGEYWTLREKYDFVILGVDEDFCDITINQDNSAELAIKMMKNQINIIMDLSGIDDRSRQEIASIYIDTIIENSKDSSPTQLIIEEASRFARKGDSSSANIKCTGSLKKIAQFGRKRQISAFYNTQRIVQLHKDIVAECNTQIIGKVQDIADINRVSEILGMKNSRDAFEKLNHEFFAKGFGFDHSDCNKPVKFKSDCVNSRHLKSTRRNKNSHPKPNEKVQAWILLMGGKLPNDLKVLLKEEKASEPEVKIEISEDDKIKDIVKYFGKINLPDLYVLLNRDNFADLSASFEFNLFCKKNTEFQLNENTIYYLEDDTDSIKITSDFVLKTWKEKIKDYDYCKILTYLYETNNDRNRIQDLEKILGLRKESIMIACNAFESLNLTKIINGSIYLNTVLFFDKDDNSNFDDSFEDLNEDDDDFFNKDDD